LVNWKDRKFTLDNPKEFFQKLTSEKNYTDTSRKFYPVDVIGSVRDYFFDNSMGKFDPTFDVVGPIDIDYSCEYPCPRTEDGKTDNTYGNRLFNIVTAVMNKVNQTINFSEYDLNNDNKIDMVYFMFAGYGSYVQGNNYKLIWPHANDFSNAWLFYDGKRLGRYACSVEIQDSESSASLPGHPWFDGIGTMCHEFSHVLGLADHYDTDYEENGETEGTGTWDIMASGADLNYGLTPVGYNAFERYMLDFADERMLTETGDYTLNPFDTSNEYYKLGTGSASDDFFLENRQRQGWDTYLPGHGLLVWRADTSRPSVWTGNTVNNNASHNYFEILGAFPGSNNTIDLTPTSTPALLSWAKKEAKQDLYDIKEENGIVTFKAGKNLYPTLVEDFEDTPLTSTNATGLAGRICTWNLSNATIESTENGHGNGQHVAKIKPNGTIVSSKFTYGLHSLKFTVQRAGATKLQFAVQTSTDGIQWTALQTPAGKSIFDFSLGQKESVAFYNIPAGCQIRFVMASKTSTAVCYLDDIEFSLSGDDTAINTVDSKPLVRQTSIFNLSGQRVAEGYKGLVIKNGKKYISK
jgi:M6 family metalloprotease-like protein